MGTFFDVKKYFDNVLKKLTTKYFPREKSQWLSI